MKDTRISKELRRRGYSPSLTSELVNDSGFITTVTHKVNSVNGRQGDVVLDIPVERRMETFRGSTNATGQYSVVYSTPYPDTPEVHPQIISGSPSQTIVLSESTASGFTITVTEKTSTSVLGVSVLSSTSNPVSGSTVSVLVVAR